MHGRAIQQKAALVTESAIVLLAGLVVVLIGAELVLRGSAKFAALLGVKPILIGLTIVSIGTSAPELAVGITAAAEGRGELAVGNIAGTNMVNILLILGLSAWIRPLPLHMQTIKLDLPAMIAASIALIVMAWDGTLSRFDGALLVFAAVVYTVVLVRLTRRESGDVKREFAEEYGAPAKRNTARTLGYLAMVIVGIAVTVKGADLFVNGAVGIAQVLGVSDAIIGLTVVAIGTSAPELATTIVATFKDDRDVAVGNLLGSSSYNILAILGVTCLATPGGLHVGPEILFIDLPLAAAVALICVPVFKSDRRVSRWEGAFFVLSYIVYLAWLLFIRA